MSMTMEKIIHALESLVNIHGSFIDLSKEKTELIKKSKTDELQSLLNKERMRIQKLEQAESKRQQAVKQWMNDRNVDDETLTITEIIDMVQDQKDKDRLEKVTISLTKHLTELKQQEALNNALIQQSMQYVQYHLQLLQPTIDDYNYGETQTQKESRRSVFDSKA